MQKPGKRFVISVGVGVAGLALAFGTSAVATAATASVTTSHHSVVEHPREATTLPTATPIPTHDANDDNGVEHPTPEPGDDDAPGTADHHGGRTGVDDNGVDNDAAGHHNRNRGSDDSGSNRGRGHDGSDDGAGHDGSDDNGGDNHGGHGGDDN
jgi:uncharacterized membrane protein